ncbi:glycosyltransferase [Ligilactobacillus agilis]|uniref:glycosyltransferase n=1 Tax=Ligilactobacillus agilis TaxID=1601 RepID=UPI003F8A6C58
MLPTVTSYRNYRQELRAKYNLKAEQPALTVLVLVTTALELDRCLESIYYQDYPNLELVVVDMSEAATVLASLQKYQAIYGDIKYYQASSTTNAVELIQGWANQAKGELMTVISSKDCFNKNEPFRQMVTYLQQEQLDLIGSMHMRYLTEDGSFRGFPVSGEFEDTGSHSIADLVASYAGEYQQLSGFIFKRELLATSEPATSELELVKNLLVASQKRATWKDYAWILTVK